jgi:hypothetical protein
VNSQINNLCSLKKKKKNKFDSRCGSLGMIFYLGFQWKKTILDALGMTALTLDKHATKVFKGK